MRHTRDAQATRAAILAAARACFSEDSYEGVGMRQVAARAGISPALVIRYFGSKEELFRQTLRKAFEDLDMERFVAGDLNLLGERMVRELLSVHFTPSLRLSVRASANPQTAGLVRELTDEYLCVPLARRLPGENAALRADLISAYIFGIAIHHFLVGLEPLASAQIDAIAAQAARGLQPLIDGL